MAAGSLASLADDADQMATALLAAAGATDTTWTGVAADAYRASAATHVTATAPLPGNLTETAAAFRVLAAALTTAQTMAADAMAESERLGLAPGDLVGRPFSVAGFVMAYPQKAEPIAVLIGQVVRARWQADDARDAFIAALAPLRSQLYNIGQQHESDRCGSDERSGRRISRDDREGLEPGGDGRSRDRGGDLDSDWAGRAILERYLRGGPAKWQ
jgi:hypothetical protein